MFSIFLFSRVRQTDRERESPSRSLPSINPSPPPPLTRYYNIESLLLLTNSSNLRRIESCPLIINRVTNRLAKKRRHAEDSLQFVPLTASLSLPFFFALA